MEIQDQNDEQTQNPEGIEDQQLPGDPSETSSIDDPETDTVDSDIVEEPGTEEEAVGSDADYTTEASLENTLTNGDEDLDSDPGNDESEENEPEISEDDATESDITEDDDSDLDDDEII